MDTSPIYIRAAEDGIADARKRDTTAVFSFGMEAVRHSGRQYRRVQSTQKIGGRDTTSVACYILASIANRKVVHLLTFIDVKLRREARMYAMVSSSIFKERLSCIQEDVKPLLMRKIAAICADILISYAHKISAARMQRMKNILDAHSNKLIQVEQLAVEANEDLAKKNLVIAALLKCRAQDEASRAHDEGICVYSETLIDSLKELMQVDANITGVVHDAIGPFQ